MKGISRSSSSSLSWESWLLYCRVAAIVNDDDGVDFCATTGVEDAEPFVQQFGVGISDIIL